jgi:hypothetical protein
MAQDLFKSIIAEPLAFVGARQSAGNSCHSLRQPAGACRARASSAMMLRWRKRSLSTAVQPSDAFASMETRFVNGTMLQRYQRACRLTQRKAWHCRHACVVARLNGSLDLQRGTALCGPPIESSNGDGRVGRAVIGSPELRATANIWLSVGALGAELDSHRCHRRPRVRSYP